MSDSYFAADRMRRSVLELKIEMLRAISEGANKQSHIIQKTNISWSMAQGFIRKLEMQGLIQSQRLKGRKIFIITERGNRVLDSYTAIMKEVSLDIPVPNLPAL